ncbi:protein of unknown function UPF0066 [Methanothermus fervidus DSM 2088]|uniref:TsaA-like domain-containing protein n=1 Tax=Methanothermus fervidus (strain ATCC 43054 / DSM 2088 / JCM 10308 / V24 S) TaxID=523846 RepID=E3GX24_METFV|nr:tRNA (N6-threonylcarbamoyladenosine(37)-N6)-methyltransferase TrmO [Methanothermus fervidus]ADP76913.1 protein of unknown function UPF0066 [Methanothermus fervidus DSM 2088]
MELYPIGIVKSQYNKRKEAPRQGRRSENKSIIKIFKKYRDGLKGIEKYKYLIVLYWMDRGNRDVLVVKRGGVFATRSPDRPNPIGMCLVKLEKVEGNKLIVKWLDALNGSPIIDIKPYFKDLDSI